MEFIKGWKFMAIIFGVLCVVSIAGVIYGVTTHTEPGFMQETPGFTSADVPIHVCAGGYVSDVEGTAAADAAVHSAVNTINERLGFEVLRVAYADCTVGIRAIVGAPAEAGWRDPGGDAEFVPGSRVCRVTTSNTGTSEILGLVLQHELGHCLGLDHDDWEGSIMRRTQSSTPDGEFPPRITDSDRGLLRALYVPAD